MANPVADMYADAVMTVVLRAESDPMPQKSEYSLIMNIEYHCKLFKLNLLH